MLTALLGANLQASFQNPLVLWSFAGLFGLLGLAMFGLYELQMPSFIQSRIDMWVRRVRGGTLLGTVAMGLLSALIIGPCVAAPLVGALIYIGQSGDLWLGGTALFVLSLGMGTPLLLVGTSAGVLVPRAGVWMVYIQHLFGLMLLAVALWIVNRLVPPALALLLWGGWLIVVGVWLGALHPAKNPARRVGQGLALVVVVYGALLMSGGASGGDRFWLPLGHLRGGAATVVHVPFKPVKTVPDLERELDGARARGQAVMLDFYADWCVDCVIMARTTFSDPRVVESLQPVLTLQADVTANDETDRALMAHLGVIGPPTILFFDASGRELRNDRVVGLLKSEPFLRHLEQVWAPPGAGP
jgi:thiol:disulfide interchange protein DsbD